MSENVKETITVTYVAKYGPKVGEDWYNLSPKSGLTPKNFEVGKTYQVLVYTSKTGKKYINQIVGEADETVETISPQQAEINQLRNQQIDNSKLMKQSIIPPKGRDFDAEARGKVACASYAAALSSPALAMYALNKEDYLTLIDVVAEKMIKKVFEKQGTL